MASSWALWQTFKLLLLALSVFFLALAPFNLQASREVWKSCRLLGQLDLRRQQMVRAVCGARPAVSLYNPFSTRAHYLAYSDCVNYQAESVILDDDDDDDTPPSHSPLIAALLKVALVVFSIWLTTWLLRRYGRFLKVYFFRYHDRHYEGRMEED